MRKPTLSLLAVVFSTACGTGAEPQDLEALNQELYVTPLQQAVDHKAHFAPLCDAQGYPLVGNIVSKPSGTQASQFCAVAFQARK
jgi:hypothetical protein